MKLTYLPLYTIACAFTTNAATVEFYSDADCGNKVGDRDVWDNSCATENPEFKSFKVTATGGWGQRLWTYGDIYGCSLSSQTGCLTAESAALFV
ncbi:uncharacterized protein BBA_09294 [Beauveria bassiana ARSEF 2860]|uniref:Uncharacterized protein n=1 Tax=Beauveria bassiana (strain ARSEF 2860) TaxID=655819 RepID=J4UG62_BEAB2|nr:uncharacterized protein BBA_09294 [Beauveria bassiana ARSEF 2860]EJP61732.1 hypothetical protein BBA_09294 [Beauveria bassiana ARSEF 2860]